MSLIDVPRIIFSGFSDPELVGNLAVGFVHELRKSGKSVACAVTSPNMKLSAVLERLSQRPVSCFHPGILSKNRIGALASIALSGAEFLVVIGACDLGGLDSYDQRVVDAINCKLLSCTRTKGQKPFDPRLLIDGEILITSDSSPVQESESFLGAVLADELVSETPFDADYMDLPPNVNRSEILKLASAAEAGLAIDKLCELAAQSSPTEVDKFTFAPQRRKTRFAVARDGCFSGGFSDNLMLLRYFGADIKEFSPIADKVLPRDIGGIYFPASYLKDYARALSENEYLKNEILNFAKAGGVIFSEGPSTALLCRSFAIGKDGKSYPGIGLLPAQASIRESELFEVELLVKEDCTLGYPGLLLRGLWAKYWQLYAVENIVSVIDISRSRSETTPGGYSPGAQIINTLSIPHFGTCREAAYNLVAAAEVFKSLG